MSVYWIDNDLTFYSALTRVLRRAQATLQGEKTLVLKDLLAIPTDLNFNLTSFCAVLNQPDPRFTLFFFVSLSLSPHLYSPDVSSMQFFASMGRFIWRQAGIANLNIFAPF